MKKHYLKLLVTVAFFLMSVQSFAVLQFNYGGDSGTQPGSANNPFSSLTANTANNTVLQQLFSSGVNPLNSVSYFIRTDTSGHFGLTALTGVAGGVELKWVSGAGTPTVGDVYKLTVTALKGTDSVRTNLYFEVPSNVNPTLTGFTTNLSENSALNKSVTTSTNDSIFTANDPDGNNALLTYTITSGNINSTFSLENLTGANAGKFKIKVLGLIDYETTQSFTLAIKATDQDGGTKTSNFTINITNINENPLVNQSYFVLYENVSSGAAVGTITVTEPDTVNVTQTHTFTILSQLGAAGSLPPFSINTSSGALTVANPGAIDFETLGATNKVIRVVVQATDAGAGLLPAGLTGIDTISVQILDANETVVTQNSFPGLGKINACSKIYITNNRSVPNGIVDIANSNNYFNNNGGSVEIYYGVFRYERIKGTTEWTSLKTINTGIKAFKRQVIDILWWSYTNTYFYDLFYADEDVSDTKEYAYKLFLYRNTTNTFTTSANFVPGFFVGKPTKASNVVATEAAGCNSIEVTWEGQDTDANKYKIYRKEKLSSGYDTHVLIANLYAPASSYSHINLPNSNFGKKYQYEVETINSATQGCENSDLALSNDGFVKGIPTAPTSLSMSINDVCSETSFNWEYTNDITTPNEKFVLYRKIGSGASLLVDSANASIRELISYNVSRGNISTYELKAKNSCGSSASSNQVIKTIDGVSAAPTNTLASTEIINSQPVLKLSFDQSVVLPHNIYRNGNLIKELDNATTAYYDLEIPACEINYYTIGSVNTCGIGALDSTQGIIIPDLSMGTVAATDGAYPDKTEINWNDIFYETGYRVYRDNTLIALTDENVQLYTDVTALPGNVHEYHIQAVNACNQSLPSSDEGYVDPNGIISGHIATNGGQYVKDVVVKVTPTIGKSLKLNGVELGSGNSASFNGTSNALTVPGVLNFSNGFTFETWINPSTSSAATMSIFNAKLNGAGGSDLLKLEYSVSQRNLVLTTYQCQSACFNTLSTPANNINPNAWYHIAVTISASGFGKILVNGQLKNSGFVYLPYNSSNNNVIGASSINSNFFKGNMDETRIYQREKTQSEVTEEWASEIEVNTAINLARYYTYNAVGSTNNIFPDLSINGINATMTGTNTLSAASPAVPVTNGSHIAVGVIDSTLTLGSQSITLSMWLKADPGNIDNRFVFSGFSQGPKVQFTVGKSVSNVPNMYSNASNTRINASTQINDNQWHNVTYVYDRPSQKMKIYVDGALEATGNGGVINWSNWNIALGAEAGGKFPFKGYMDDVALWNVALDSATIGNYYNWGLSGEEANLIGYWKLDEGQGSRAFDRTTYKNNGNLWQGGTLSVWASNTIAPVQNIAKTDTLGNYIIKAINYGTSVNGTNFTVTPSFFDNGVYHVFNPTNKTRTLSFVQTKHNGVDFIDISTYQVSGYLKYKNTTCFIANKEFQLDDQVVNPVAMTNAQGVWSIDSPLGIHKFSPTDSLIFPDSVLKNVNMPYSNIKFESHDFHTVSGKVTGNCGVTIGSAVVNIKTDNNCFNKNYPIDPQGNYFADSVPPMQIIVNVIPNNQLITFDALNFKLDKDTIIDFMYRTDLQAEILFADSTEHIDNCGNSIWLMNEGTNSYADIRVFEEYPGGNRCYLDSAVITISNDIADLSESVDTSFSNKPNGTIRTKFKVGAAFLGGSGNLQYKKKIEVLVQDSLGRSVVATNHIMVQGARKRPNTFTTASPRQVFTVLRDPPGDQSRAYFAKDSTYCYGWEYEGSTSLAIEIENWIKPGVDVNVGWVAEVSISAKGGPYFGGGATGTVNYGSGLETCFTLAEEISTDATGQFTGEDMDLYAGASLNYSFAKLDLLSYDLDSCKVDLRTILSANVEDFNTVFYYTGKHIVDEVIPNLEYLKSQQTTTAGATKYQNEIDGWNLVMTQNKAQKSAAQAIPYLGNPNKNVSFSYGTSIASAETFDTTSTTSWGGEFEIYGFYGAKWDVDPGTEGQFTAKLTNINGRNNVNTTARSYTIGYELGDDDPGDFFSVDIKKDLTYGTLVFQTVAGESMCPHEENTVPREGLALTMAQSTQTNVDPDELAVFNLTVSNLSQTEEDFVYGVKMLQSSNPLGAEVRLNGGIINSGVSFTVPGTLGENTVDALITVKKSPIAYDFTGLQLQGYSDCEMALDGDLEAESILTFNAYFSKPCTELRILNPDPTQEWIVDNNSNDQITISFTDYDTASTTLSNFKLQYRPDNGTWADVASLDWADIVNSNADGSTPLYSSLTWNISQTLPDAKYYLRIKANCMADVTFSEVLPGVVSREAPVVFGTPQPADGILDANDEISITFNEDIDCSKLNVESVTLRGVLSGFDYHSNAVSFDGVNDYGRIPYNSAYNFGSLQDFTVECWVKTNNNVGDPVIVSNKDWSNGRNKGWAISVRQGNKWRFNIGDGPDMVNVDGGIIGDNQWHHLAAAVDRDNVVTIFQDGLPIGSASLAPIQNINNTLPICIAQDGTTAYQYYFQGQVDEVRLWNIAKSQLQVIAGLYRSYDFEAPNLKGLWRLDEGANNSFRDDALAQNHGVLYNNPTWITQNAAPISMDDVESIINISTQCSGPKIIIQPLIPIKYLENATLTAKVLDAKDMFGNQIVQPVEWQFTVDKNPVRWEIANTAQVKQESENLTFAVKLKNTGGFNEPYTITNIPSWLQVQPTTGTIPAGWDEQINFTVDSFVNPGTYNIEVVASTDKGYEPLNITVTNLCPAPQWQVNPTAYEYSMNVTGFMVIEGDTSKDIYDKIAAYVGDEIRGVAPIQKVGNQHLFFLTVYSDSVSNENIKFRAWDASACQEFVELSPQISFTANSNVGSITSPLLVTTTGLVAQEIDLNEGWTWISLNVNADSAQGYLAINDVLQSLSADSSDLIRGQDTTGAILTSLYYPTVNMWAGTLDSMTHLTSYQIKMDAADHLRYVGKVINPLENHFDVKVGWNWVGYYQRGVQDINEALSSMAPLLQTGDIIKSQYGYAEFVSGDKWYGSLQYLEPGVGYMLKSSAAGSLSYPPIVSGKVIEPQNYENLRYDPAFRNIVKELSWNINPAAYRYSTYVTAEIAYADEVPLKGDKNILAAFVGDEMRGIAYGRMVRGKMIYYMPIYQNTTDKEKISFKVFVMDEMGTAALVEVANLDGNTTLGSTKAPFVLHLGSKSVEDPEVETTQLDGYYLGTASPNPFITETNIEFGIGADVMVTMNLFNVEGQVVKTLVAKKLTAGTYKVAWDGTGGNSSRLPAGVYYCHLSAGDYYETKKIVLFNLDK